LAIERSWRELCDHENKLIVVLENVEIDSFRRADL
jgi:hypothetical protein